MIYSTSLFTVLKHKTRKPTYNPKISRWPAESMAIGGYHNSPSFEQNPVKGMPL